MIQLGSAYGEIQIGTGDAERNVNSLASSMKRVGGTMSAAVSAPLLAIGAAGLSAAAGFEQSMNQIAVVSGATESAMVGLNDKALQLGRDTSFSAGEAAAGMLELSKAGLDAEQTMSAIGGVLDLAAAGGLSVADAASISANALNAFKLPASDATRVANLLAAAANSSSMEVGDMALAFQASSAVFASNGQQIDDLSTAIALLANNGIKGSDAGTSLKTMLMRLAAPTDTAADALSGLGVQVYNADGSMRSFQDIIANLVSATANLSAEQRNAAFTTIFGADAIRAANILVDEGVDSYAAMRESVNKAGAATEVANSRMKGLAGAIAYAKGTIESTLIAAFQPLLDTIGNLIRAGADLFGMFGALPEPVRNAALAFAAVLAAAGPLMVAIPMIGSALAALVSPIGLIVIAVAALAAAWVADFGGIRTTTMAVWGAIQPVLERWAGIAADLLGAIKWIWEGKADNIDWWWDIAEAMGFSGDTALRVGDMMYDAGLVAQAALQYVSKAVNEAKAAVAAGWITIRDAVTIAVENFTWSNFITALTDWSTYVPAIEWASYIGQLLWDNAVIPAVNWASYIGTLAWDSAVVTAVDWGTYITSLDWSSVLGAALDWTAYLTKLTWDSAVIPAINWATYIGALSWDAIVAIDWGTYIAALTDWSTYVGTLAWDTVVTQFSDWGTYLTTLDWKTIIEGAIDWATYIIALPWNTFVSGIDLATYVGAFLWSNYIADFTWPATSDITWSNFITALTDWGTYIGSLDWGAYITAAVDWGTYIAAFTWNSFVDKLQWPVIATVLWENYIANLEWPSITWPGWNDWVTALAWPSITWPGWNGWITKLRWPSITWPGWRSFIPDLEWPTIPPFPGWDWLQNLNPFASAVGSSLLPGGFTLVGERGPEIITAPHGSKILTNGQSRRLAAEGGRGSGLTVAFYNTVIRNEADLDALAYRVGRKLAAYAP